MLWRPGGHAHGGAHRRVLGAAVLALVAVLLPVASPDAATGRPVRAPGQPDLPVAQADRGTSTPITSTDIHDIVADPLTGRVFVSGGARVEVFAADGTPVAELTGVVSGRGLDVDGGLLHVADVGADRIVVIDTTTLATVDAIDLGATLVGEVVRDGDHLWAIGQGSDETTLLSHVVSTGTTTVRPLGRQVERLEPDAGTPGRFVGWTSGGRELVLLDDAPTPVVATARTGPITDAAAHGGFAHVTTGTWGPSRHTLPDLQPVFTLSTRPEALHVEIDAAADLRLVASRQEITVTPALGAPVSHKTGTGVSADAGLVAAPDAGWFYAVGSGWNQATGSFDRRSLVAYPTRPVPDPVPSVAVGVPTTLLVTGSGFRTITSAAVDGTFTTVHSRGATTVAVEVPGTLAIGTHELAVTSPFGTGTTPLEVVPDTGAGLVGVIRGGAGDRVPAATITLEGGGLAAPIVTVANDIGRYELHGLPLGDDYRMTVDAPSTALVDQVITGIVATPNLTTQVDVLLGARPTGRDGATIAAGTLPARPDVEVSVAAGALVHHDATGRTFVGRSDGLLVLDPDLALVGRVEGAVDAVTLDGTAVLVLRDGAKHEPGAVVRVDPSTLAVTGRWSLGQHDGTVPRYGTGRLAATAGAAWSSTTDGLVSVDTTTGEVRRHDGALAGARAPVGVDGAASQLVTFDGTSSHRWDTTTDPPTLLTTYPSTQLVAASADLGLAWTADGHEVALVDGTATGRGAVGSAAATPGGGGLVAATGPAATRLQAATGDAVTHQLPGGDAVHLSADGTRAVTRAGGLVTLWDLTPLVLGVAPAQVVMGVPADVHLTGHGLGGVSSVRSGGLEAAVTVEGPDALRVLLDPATPAGTTDVQLTAPYGASTAALAVVDNVGAQLVGTVTGPDGPIAGAQLTLDGPALATPRSTTTAGDGSFAITGVPLGDDHRLRVVDPSGAGAAQTVSHVALRPNDERTLDVHLSPAQVTAVDGAYPSTDLGTGARSLASIDGVGVVATLGDEVVVLDDRARVVARVLGRAAATDAAGLDGALWVRVAGGVERIDPATWRVTDHVATPPLGGEDVAVADGRLWVTASDAPGPRALVAVDPALGTATAVHTLWHDARVTDVRGPDQHLVAWGADLAVLDPTATDPVLASETSPSRSWGTDALAASSAVGAAWTSDGFRIDLTTFAPSRFADLGRHGGVALSSQHAIGLGGSVHLPEQGLPSLAFAEGATSAWSSDEQVLLVDDGAGVITPWRTTPTLTDADPGGLGRDQEVVVGLTGRTIEAATSVTVAGTAVAIDPGSPWPDRLVVTVPAEVTDVPLGTPLPVTVTTPLGSVTADALLVVGPTTPDEPEDVSAHGWNGIAVFWEPPDDDGGAPVIGYDVRIGDRIAHLDPDQLAPRRRGPTPDDPGWRLLDVEAPPGQLAEVAVRAVNDVGPGRWADADPVVPGGHVAASPDVPVDHPLWAEITAALVHGVTAGFGDGTFRPGQAVTRQTSVTLLWRAAGSPTGPFPGPAFTDVAPSSPFATPIAWAVAEGITTGYADGTFRPTTPVTRQTALAFQWRAAGAPAGPFPGSAFTDVSPSSPFATPIAWAVAEGITTGYADGSFGPTAAVTRQSQVAFLVRPWWPTWQPWP